MRARDYFSLLMSRIKWQCILLDQCVLFLSARQFTMRTFSLTKQSVWHHRSRVAMGLSLEMSTEVRFGSERGIKALLFYVRLIRTTQSLQLETGCSPEQNLNCNREGQNWSCCCCCRCCCCLEMKTLHLLCTWIWEIKIDRVTGIWLFVHYITSPVSVLYVAEDTRDAWIKGSNIIDQFDSCVCYYAIFYN